jgi:hypothetical protein
MHRLLMLLLLPVSCPKNFLWLHLLLVHLLLLEGPTTEARHLLTSTAHMVWCPVRFAVLLLWEWRRHNLLQAAYTRCSSVAVLLPVLLLLLCVLQLS